MSSLGHRPMRKGTRSCLECRRRKIRCIFPADGTQSCIPCQSRNSPCTEQHRAALQAIATADSRVTLAKLSSKVAELEAVIKSTGKNHENVDADHHILHPVVVPQPVQKLVPIKPLYPSTSASTDDSNVIVPISPLFDNAIWSRDHTKTDSETVAKEAARVHTNSALLERHSQTRNQLLEILPAPKLLTEILEATCFWWTTWRAIAPWVLEGIPDRYSKTLPEFVAFALGSIDPALVGLGLLCTAASIQHIDSSHQHILRQLPSPPGELFHKYFSCVDVLILNDSNYACSMIGLGVAVLASKLLMNLGLIKKTWLLLHRTISHGQLLGLQSPQRSQNESEDAESQRQRSWLYLCQLDLYTSLLIGLPYAMNGNLVLSNDNGRRGTRLWFQSQLLKLSAQVIDRNQAGLGISTEMTEELQKNAALVAYAMDQDFWDAPADLRIGREEYRERITSHLWYHQIRVLIHMPLMIHSIENPGLEDHKSACLTGCREVLKIYQIMRSDPAASFSLVKLIDYQVFICATLLLLGRLASGPPCPVRSQSFHHDRDWELVESTLEILRQASKTLNNSIAAQALEGLETLASLVQGRHACPSSDRKCLTPYVKIVVPFSGTITISPGSFYKGSRASSPSKLQSSAPPISLSSNDSHQNSQNQPTEPSYDMTVDHLENGFGRDNREEEFPYIDFGWENMIGVNAEDDWAWLSDIGLHAA